MKTYTVTVIRTSNKAKFSVDVYAKNESDAKTNSMKSIDMIHMIFSLWN